jgi:hypothetical protein
MSDGTLGFHINSTSGTGVFLTSPSASPISEGAWSLFTVTRSGSTYTFYENATSLGAVGDSTVIPAIAASLTIGQTGDAIGFVNGRLSETSASGVRNHGHSLPVRPISAKSECFHSIK